LIYFKEAEQVDYINQLFQLAAKRFQEGRIKVSNGTYYSSNWDKFILTYFIKTGIFELVPEEEIKRRFYLANSKIALNEIPLCRIFRFTSVDDWFKSNKKFNEGCVERLKRILSDPTSTNIVVSEYLGFNSNLKLTSKKYLYLSAFLKSCFKLVEENENLNIFEYLDFENPLHKSTLGYIKKMIEKDGLKGLDEISPPFYFGKYFFRDEDNGGLMNYLFTKEEVSKLLEDYYQIIKNDKSLLGKIYNYTHSYQIWKDHSQEILKTHVKDFENSQQDFKILTHFNFPKFNAFITSLLLEQKKMVTVEVADFQEALPYLKLLEDKNLTVIVSGNETILDTIGEDSYTDYGEVNYFKQSVATNNLFVPVSIPEMEILKMVEQYKLYQNYSNLQISDFWKDVLNLLVSYNEFSNSEFEQLPKVRKEIKKLFQQNYFEHIEYLRPH
jgi:hypothetical protein